MASPSRNYSSRSNNTPAESHSWGRGYVLNPSSPATSKKDPAKKTLTRAELTELHMQRMRNKEVQDNAKREKHYKAASERRVEQWTPAKQAAPTSSGANSKQAIPQPQQRLLVGAGDYKKTFVNETRMSQAETEFQKALQKDNEPWKELDHYYQQVENKNAVLNDICSHLAEGYFVHTAALDEHKLQLPKDILKALIEGCLADRTILPLVNFIGVFNRSSDPFKMILESRMMELIQLSVSFKSTAIPEWMSTCPELGKKISGPLEKMRERGSRREQGEQRANAIAAIQYGRGELMSDEMTRNIPVSATSRPSGRASGASVVSRQQTAEGKSTVFVVISDEAVDKQKAFYEQDQMQESHVISITKRPSSDSLVASHEIRGRKELRITGNTTIRLQVNCEMLNENNISVQDLATFFESWVKRYHCPSDVFPKIESMDVMDSQKVDLVNDLTLELATRILRIEI